ncbi:MAG: F420-nonreducing hydrogenase [Candidatus Bathyarchaeia archaeon]
MAKVCKVSLTSCAGCVMSPLYAGEGFLDMLKDVEVVYSPIFIDVREVPKVDVAMVEGGVRTVADENLLRAVKARAELLVAVGDCAVYGGVTSLGNVFSMRAILEEVYSATMKTASILPRLKDMMYPIDTYVDVDYYIPGCPPTPNLIINAVKSIVEDKEPPRTSSAVCSECGRKMVMERPKHLAKAYEKVAEPKICLLSQGFLCLGPVTRAGCGALCTKPGMPCYGCRGPSDGIFYKVDDLYNILIRIISVRTQIPIEEVKKEIYHAPFVFHAIPFSKRIERFKSKRKMV